MSGTKRTTTGTLVLTGMVCALSATFIFEWRDSRASARSFSSGLGHALGDLSRALDDHGRKNDVLASRLAGIGSSLSNMEETLRGEGALLCRIDGLLKEGVAIGG